MSSPFSRETKRGTEETIEALSRTQTWASRIDTRNDATEIDMSFIDELQSEESRLREKYKIKTTEREIDNFVFNNEEAVINILCGDLDTKVDAIKELQSYISEEFGYVSPLSLNKEELVWLVAQEVLHHQSSSHGLEIYDEEPVSEVALDSVGVCPDRWSDEFPIYNRNL